MLLATEFLDKLFIFSVLALILVGLPAAVIGGLFFYRYQQQWTKRAFVQIYDGLNTHHEPQPGDVIVRYDTYHGFIAFTTHTPHEAILPADDARTLLKRLLWFNLTWGLFAYLSIFTVPLAIINYIVQRRSITAQAQGVTFSPDPVDSGNPYASPRLATSTELLPAQRAVAKPSAFSLVMGIVCFGLGTIFAVSVIFCLFLDIKAALGNTVLAALLYSTAYHYLKREK